MAENTPDISQNLGVTGSIAGDYFDRLYAANADPWGFSTSAYEARKYKATLAALPRPSYENGLEIGCSIGVLTAQLATRCKRLLAVDISIAALAQARERCASLTNVDFECQDVVTAFPAGRFDLILISEVGYYLSLPDLEILRRKVAAAVTPGGHLLLVHYTGETNYPLTSDAVHEAFLDSPDPLWTHRAAQNKESYRLDLLQRNGDLLPQNERLPQDPGNRV